MAFASITRLQPGCEVDYRPPALRYWLLARVESVSDDGTSVSVRFSAGGVQFTHSMDLRIPSQADRLAPAGLRSSPLLEGQPVDFLHRSGPAGVLGPSEQWQRAEVVVSHTKAPHKSHGGCQNVAIRITSSGDKVLGVSYAAGLPASQTFFDFGVHRDRNAKAAAGTSARHQTAEEASKEASKLLSRGASGLRLDKGVLWTSPSALAPSGTAASWVPTLMEIQPLPSVSSSSASSAGGAAPASADAVYNRHHQLPQLARRGKALFSSFASTANRLQTGGRLALVDFDLVDVLPYRRRRGPSRRWKTAEDVLLSALLSSSSSSAVSTAVHARRPSLTAPPNSAWAPASTSSSSAPKEPKEVRIASSHPAALWYLGRVRWESVDPATGHSDESSGVGASRGSVRRLSVAGLSPTSSAVIHPGSGVGNAGTTGLSGLVNMAAGTAQMAANSITANASSSTVGGGVASSAGAAVGAAMGATSGTVKAFVYWFEPALVPAASATSASGAGGGASGSGGDKMVVTQVLRKAPVEAFAGIAPAGTYTAPFVPGQKVDCRAVGNGSWSTGEVVYADRFLLQLRTTATAASASGGSGGFTSPRSISTSVLGMLGGGSSSSSGIPPSNAGGGAKGANRLRANLVSPPSSSSTSSGGKPLPGGRRASSAGAGFGKGSQLQPTSSLLAPASGAEIAELAKAGLSSSSSLFTAFEAKALINQAQRSARSSSAPPPSPAPADERAARMQRLKAGAAATPVPSSAATAMAMARPKVGEPGILTLAHSFWKHCVARQNTFVDPDAAMGGGGVGDGSGGGRPQSTAAKDGGGGLTGRRASFFGNPPSGEKGGKSGGGGSRWPF